MATELFAVRLIGHGKLTSKLDNWLTSSADATQPAVLVSGPAGIGKSRLLRHVADQAGAQGAWVLDGRAVDTAHPDTHRCLVEALSRFDVTSGSQPGDHLWVAWRAALRALGSSGGSSLAVAEELLRFLRTCRRRAPVLLLLDDLQWAEQDTLEALTYLCDNRDAHGALIAMSARPDDLGAGVARMIERRAVTVFEIPPLDDQSVQDLVLECLRVDAVDPALTAFIVERSGGIPFAVEELLAGLARSGAITPDGTGWRVEGTRLRTFAPPTVAASILRRTASLPTRARTVLNAAAVLGHRFDWRLLAPMTNLGEDEVATALREAHDAGLVTGTEAGMAFRHALTRDEVARRMLAPDRRSFARRALAEIGSAEDLDDGGARLALELAEYADDDKLRRSLLLQSGLRAAERGALGQAARYLRFVVDDAGATRDAVWVEAATRLTEALSRTGDHASSRQIGVQVLESTPEASAERRVRTALAQAALAAGENLVADREIKALDRDQNRETDPSIGVLRSELFLRRGDLSASAELARHVLQSADTAQVRCEAMEILGRAARVSDVTEATAWFEQELAEADRVGDLHWQARAYHELGTIDLLDNLRIDRLQAARRLAVENGDPHTIVHTDFHLAEALVSRGETLKGRIIAERAADLAARIGSPVLPWAWLTIARSHAHDRDDPSMEAAVERAQACAGTERDAIEAGVSGRVTALRALFDADAAAALDALDAAVICLQSVPGHHFPHWGLWALLRASTGRLLPSDVDLLSRSAGAGTRFNQALLTAAHAIRSGAEGRAAAAGTEFRQAEELLAGYQHADWMVHVARWITLPCAAVDGWGDPIAWAQDGVRWFAAHQQEPLASSCRRFLRDAGASIPRRGRGQSQVPAPLLDLGVSSREVDVLALIALRLPNSEIAGRLVLSPRTVERHVGSLLAKTGAENRGELAQIAEDLHLS